MKIYTLTFARGLGLAAVLCALTLTTTQSFADATGRAGRSGATAGVTCASAACHAAGAAIPTVTFSGAAVTAGAATVVAGSTTNFTVTVAGGPALNWGIDVAAPGATLVASGPGTKLLRNDVVHSAAATTGTFTFDLIAPATAGTITVFAAGLSGNNDTADTGDGTGVATMTVTVTAPAAAAPVATITGAPATAVVGVSVPFDGSTSTPPTGGTITAYAWNFGDGVGTATTALAPYTYTAAGNYTVTLTVTDNTGATNVATQAITVQAAGTPVAPTANPGGPYTGTAGTAISFTGSGTDPDGTIASYAWVFGDGTGTSALMSPSYTYAAAGTFTVSLTVTDNTGLTGTATTTATVAAAGGGGGAVPTPTAGGALYDQFCASCHGPNGAGTPASNVVGESAEDIIEAIAAEPTMADLATLTPEEIDAIAAFLADPTGGAPAPAAGSDLYVQFCEACHGVNGVGGPDGDVVGASAEDIAEAIEEYPEMATPELQALTEAELEEIALFLEDPTAAPANVDGKATGSKAKPSASAPPAGSKPATTASGASGGGSIDWLLLAASGALLVRRRRTQ